LPPPYDTKTHEQDFLFAENREEVLHVALTWMIPHPERFDSQARQYSREPELPDNQHGKEVVPHYSGNAE